ncbi:hypothetical protein BJV74DRAFT_796261 [Russula compacta]|nr:hypothetical protein BJV74DRAFT_796261 [Russula compacta]
MTLMINARSYERGRELGAQDDGERGLLGGAEQGRLGNGGQCQERDDEDDDGRRKSPRAQQEVLSMGGVGVGFISHDMRPWQPFPLSFSDSLCGCPRNMRDVMATLVVPKRPSQATTITLGFTPRPRVAFRNNSRDKKNLHVMSSLSGGPFLTSWACPGAPHRS